MGYVYSPATGEITLSDKLLIVIEKFSLTPTKLFNTGQRSLFGHVYSLMAEAANLIAVKAYFRLSIAVKSH